MASGKHAPFHLGVLIPFWVLRLILLLASVAIYGLALSILGIAKSHNEKDLKDALRDQLPENKNADVDALYNTVVAVLAVALVLVLLCLILEIVTIVKLARRTLTPRFFLIANVIQTTIWIIGFGLSVGGGQRASSIVVSVLQLLLFIGLLIYASVLFHRHRMAAKKGLTQVGGMGPEKQNLMGVGATVAQPTGYDPYGGQQGYQMGNMPPQPAAGYAQPPQQQGYNAPPIQSGHYA